MSMVQDLKNQWDEPSMGCMPHRTKEMGDKKFLGCTIRVEPTRDVSSGDETSLHQKYYPNGYYISGRFVLSDVLSLQTFCPHGRFIPRTDVMFGGFFHMDVLSAGRFSPTAL
jgi:hypothetical protein